MYHTLIIASWFCGFQTNRIIKLQKKALRIITLSNYNSHTEPLHKKLSMLKVDDILKLQQLTFYKYSHNSLPVYLQNWRIIFNYDIHNYDTRIKNEICTYKTKHEFAKKCLRHNLPFLLNNIPTIVKEKLNTHSLQGFAQYAKLYFLQNYQDSCTKQNCYICMQH